MQSPAKAAIRESIRKGGTLFPEKWRAQASASICDRTAALPVWRQAARILIYWPLADEVDVRGLLAAAPHADFALPVVRGEGMEAVPFDRAGALKPAGLGTLGPDLAAWHPIDPGEMDLVVVPGRAFDPSGHRLGRGGGYYDRFLERFPRGIPKVGVAFSFQMFPGLPFDSHDIPMDFVVTEEGIFVCGQN